MFFLEISLHEGKHEIQETTKMLLSNKSINAAGLVTLSKFYSLGVINGRRRLYNKSGSLTPEKCRTKACHFSANWEYCHLIGNIFFIQRFAEKDSNVHDFAEEGVFSCILT